jgi:hypothetical protein
MRTFVEGTAFRANIVVALEVDVVFLDVVKSRKR